MSRLNRSRVGLSDQLPRPRDLPQQPGRKGENCFRQRDCVLAEADINFGIILSITQSKRLFEIGFCFGEIALPEAGKTQVAAGHSRFDHATFDLRFAEEPLRSLPRQTYFATGGATQPLAVIGGKTRCCAVGPRCEFLSAVEGNFCLLGTKASRPQQGLAVVGLKSTSWPLQARAHEGPCQGTFRLGVTC